MSGLPGHSSGGTGSESLSGLVERVTFHSPESGFCVLRARVRGHRDLVTVICKTPSIQPGEYLQASGRWVNHRDHGLQFQAELLRTSPPHSLEGIERYLGSGLIKGIGPVLAKGLVTAFGEQVFDVIESAPGRLKELRGIGPKRAQRVVEGWADQKAIREIMIFLQSHGVGTARAVRIYKTYGADAISLVTENPYCLARDIRGIGFLTADRIAEKLGLPRTSVLRARAGIVHTLEEAVARGHCGLPRDELLETAAKLLETPRERLEDALEQELQAGAVMADTIGDRSCIFLVRLWNAERAIAGRIRALSTGRPPWPRLEAGRAIPWVEGKLGVALAEGQREALRQGLASKVMVITGGPGVGKTTLVNALLRVLAAKGIECALCAPTGRAARRLGEAAGMEARTIHRLLEFDPRKGRFKRGVRHPLDCDLLVVDETSMVDVILMASLLEALPDRAALLLVGDADQLPSVGPGQVLVDLIASGSVLVTRLTRIFRQAAESRIVVNAHRVNAGRMPDLDAPPAGTTRDFYFVEAGEPEVALDRILEAVCHRIPRRFGLDPVRDIQVLCPMNRGSVGARSLNVKLQAALNTDGGQGTVERFGYTYRPGDKVMQTRNDYDKEVFNGDIGYVEGIDPDARELTVSFDDRRVGYDFGELDELALAYATSIHKSQGSEYPAVVLPLLTQHYPMLQRNLVYTGITRGKQLVVLVGQRKALALAVRGRREARRWSKLCERLGAPAPRPIPPAVV